MVTQHYPQLGTRLARGPLTQPVAWSSPPVCLLKFNVDGAKSKGVLNNKKEVMFMFLKHVWINDSNQAKV